MERFDDGKNKHIIFTRALQDEDISGVAPRENS